VVTDPKILQFIRLWIFGTRDAARPENAANQAEAGYAANYREQNGSPEIGVYAIRMKNPPAPLPPTGVPNQGRLVKGSVVIFYWSDGRAGAPDLGCFDIVRRHIEGVDFR
jgi:hypothetical protein